MPLVHNAVYTIRNDLTHTVLDLTAGAAPRYVLGWGSHGGNNQKWRLIRVGAPNLNTWKLQNQEAGRFLCPEAGGGNRRLVGLNVDTTATFHFQRIKGPSERYRISPDANGARVIALETGANLGIAAPQRVQDLSADGAFVALQNPSDAAHSLSWSFDPVVQLPLEDGDYMIRNSHTGTFLDLESGSNNAPAQGRNSYNTTIQKWFVEKHGHGYRFKSFHEENRFLVTTVAAAEVGDALSGQALPGETVRATFHVRKVPGSHLYKIFHGILAVNLEAAAIVELEASEAQKWNFIPVGQLEDGTYQIINENGNALGLESGDEDAAAQSQDSVPADANQKWVVTRKDDGGYTFKSLRENNHFLAPEAAVGDDVALQGRETAHSFTVQKLPGKMDYSIFSGVFAVNRDGAAVRLQAAAAERWTFVSVAQLEDGDYHIINGQSALDLQSGNNNAEARRVAVAGAQKWTVRKDQNGSGYTFKSSRGDRLFLTHSADPVAAGGNLKGENTDSGQSFIVWRVPGQNLYQIFLNNLAVQLPGANDQPVTFQAVDAAAVVQRWSFRR